MTKIFVTLTKIFVDKLDPPPYVLEQKRGRAARRPAKGWQPVARNQRKRPTDGELEILRVVWKHGPCTVRHVHGELNRDRRSGYTTVLKLMQIMTDKGLLRRDESVRPQVYQAARPQRDTQKQLLGDLLDRAFSGSPGKLVLQALSAKKTTPQERRQIRDLLDQLERNAR